MALIRSLLFYLGYYVSLVPHGTLCIVIGIFLPVKTRYRYFLLWNRFCLWWLKLTCGVRYEVVGRENVPPGPFVILANHQSPWETIFLYWEFQPACAILKKELLRIPFFGWSLRLLQPIAIDRSKPGQALQQLLEQGRQHLKDGINVLVFPEGTRVKPGAEKKFSAGGAELAISAGTPVIPVAHNAGLCWPAHGIIKRPGTIQVVIGRPVATAGRDARELTREVETWIRQEIRL